MSTLMNYLFKMLSTNSKTVALYNYQSVQAEHTINSLATILIKHFTRVGRYWPKYLPFAMYSYNTFSNPNLNGFIPYE